MVETSVALVVLGGVHHLVERLDRIGGLVVEVEQVVVEFQVGQAERWKSTEMTIETTIQSHGCAHHVAVPGVDEMPGGVARLGLQLLRRAVAVAQDEDGREARPGWP